MCRKAAPISPAEELKQEPLVSADDRSATAGIWVLDVRASTGVRAHCNLAGLILVFYHCQSLSRTS
jgi:hypothetical protein